MTRLKITTEQLTRKQLGEIRGAGTLYTNATNTCRTGKCTTEASCNTPGLPVTCYCRPATWPSPWSFCTDNPEWPE